LEKIKKNKKYLYKNNENKWEEERGRKMNEKKIRFT
jgi:hypothetical protein